MGPGVITSGGGVSATAETAGFGCTSGKLEQADSVTSRQASTALRMTLISKMAPEVQIAFSYIL
jgi:hypothetical protein